MPCAHPDTAQTLSRAHSFEFPYFSEILFPLLALHDAIPISTAVVARGKRWLDTALKKIFQQKAEMTLRLQKQHKKQIQSRHQLAVRTYLHADRAFDPTHSNPSPKQTNEPFVTIIIIFMLTDKDRRKRSDMCYCY